jgi:hypothetical protein
VTFNIGDTVTFMQQYGPAQLKFVGGEYTCVYKRRRRRGVVRQVLTVEHVSYETLIIEVDGESKYSRLVGMPASKVKQAGQ